VEVIEKTVSCLPQVMTYSIERGVGDLKRFQWEELTVKKVIDLITGEQFCAFQQRHMHMHFWSILVLIHFQ